MTTKQKKIFLYFFAVLYIISFFLPASHYLSDDLLGIHCAIGVIMGLLMDLDQGIQTIILDIFLILPNFLMILTFFLHKKFHPVLKYLLLLIVLLSTGSWAFTFNYPYLDTQNLELGYWIWFISSTSFMLIVALPMKKQPTVLG